MVKVKIIDINYPQGKILSGSEMVEYAKKMLSINKKNGLDKGLRQIDINRQLIAKRYLNSIGIKTEIIEETSFDNNNKKIYIINRYRDSKEVYEHNKNKLINWIKNLNKKLIVKIETTNYDWFSEYVSKYQNENIFKVLSNDRSSLKHFELRPIDQSEFIAMVNIDFLIKNKGNNYVDYKIDRVNKLFKNGEKFELPIFTISRGKVDEGNHRIKLMKELGYKSVPIYFMWK